MSVTMLLVPDSALSPSVLSDAAIAEAALGLGTFINVPHSGPAAAWSQGVYTVKAIRRGQPVPAGDDHHWLIRLMTSSDQPGAAGYHDVVNGAPEARIFITDILAAGMSWTAVTSHEQIEMMTDRWCNSAVLGTMNGVDCAFQVESCDPVERFGTIFTYGNGQPIQVTEWVLPSYFFWGNAGPYSSLGNCPAPLTPALGGRQAWAPLGGWTEAQAAPLVPEAAPASKRHISAVHDVITLGRNTPAAP